jgi:hypothetical protein
MTEIVQGSPAATNGVAMPRRWGWHAISMSSLSSDPYERDMIKFVIVWRQYGGGRSEEIFEQFGLPEREFFCRVLVLAESPSALLVLGSARVQEIRELCLSRIRKPVERLAQ